MLEIIRGCSLNKLPADNNRLADSSHGSCVPKLNTSVDLSPIVLSPSKILHRAHRLLCVTMVIAAFIALAPFFVERVLWVLLWLVFASGVFYFFRQCRPSLYETGSLAIAADHVHLVLNNKSISPCVVQKTVMWSWLMIFTMVNKQTRAQFHLVILPDSVSVDDWRRLRVWLRTDILVNTR